ncbi:type II toxin-antitoxin system HicA family toxin [Actinomadura sp. K4S16]|uniref:type II toxin-antitoxin system HicA family toxin n=1 Tax=Actinomadura sp. K4S16 TaxID=1316147 RepID=UPI0011ECCA30|nr:type II toxin-antitoxin system HicA family toxin [Actinomadura sp. K4S16]
MSPAVPTDLAGVDVCKALERGGFEHISTRGSHAKYRNGERTVIVPLHRSLAPGTLRSILRQAGWAVDDLEEHLK